MAFVSNLELTGKTSSSFHKTRSCLLNTNYFESQFSYMERYVLEHEPGKIKMFKDSLSNARECLQNYNTEKENTIISIMDGLYERWNKVDTRDEIRITYPSGVILLVSLLCFMSNKRTLEGVQLYWIIHNPELQVLIPDMPPACHIPSVETIRFILNLADREALESYFLDNFSHLKANLSNLLNEDNKEFRDTSSFDGQEVISSYQKGEYSRYKKLAIAVTVFSCNNSMVDAYTTADVKNNEDKAFASVLPDIYPKIQDNIIMADAINTKCDLIKTLNEYGIDYILCAKGNKGWIKEIIKSAFLEVLPKDEMTFSETSSGHGRIETKTFSFMKASSIAKNEDDDIYNRVKTFIKYEKTSQRVLKSNPDGAKEPSKDTRYFICTLDYSKKNFEQVIHSITSYWSIEVHHNTLDTVLFQDRFNICSINHLSARLGLNKIIYNILTYKRELIKKITGKLKRYHELMEYECSSPVSALEILVQYYALGYKENDPKRVSKVFELEED